jgi:ABC-type sulfate/molybdate transport systems ATPase subunit
MTEVDSVGQLQMRALARRLQAHAAELHDQPQRAFDLKMASELLEHLARLTTKLARPAEVPFGSGRRT